MRMTTNAALHAVLGGQAHVLDWMGRACPTLLHRLHRLLPAARRPAVAGLCVPNPHLKTLELNPKPYTGRRTCWCWAAAAWAACSATCCRCLAWAPSLITAVRPSELTCVP